MAEPALNFGPQWLRESFGGDGPGKDGGGGGGGGGGVRSHLDDGHHKQSGFMTGISSKLAAMKLAEHRYGREEMLALFDAAVGNGEKEACLTQSI